MANPVKANSSSSAHHSPLGSLPKSPPAPLAGARGASSAASLTNRFLVVVGAGPSTIAPAMATRFRVARREATAGGGAGSGAGENAAARGDQLRGGAARGDRGCGSGVGGRARLPAAGSAPPAPSGQAV